MLVLPAVQQFLRAFAGPLPDGSAHPRCSRQIIVTWKVVRQGSGARGPFCFEAFEPMTTVSFLLSTWPSAGTAIDTLYWHVYNSRKVARASSALTRKRKARFSRIRRRRCQYDREDVCSGSVTPACFQACFCRLALTRRAPLSRYLLTSNQGGDKMGRSSKLDSPHRESTLITGGLA